MASDRARSLILLILALLALSPAAALGQGARRHALIIAHDDGGPGTERLAFTFADADRVEAMLTELGGVDPADVLRLNRPGPGEVLAALDALQGAFAGGEPRWLTVYYSGHAEEDALLLGRERLPLGAFEAAVAATGAEVRLIVLDACASGSMARAKGGRRAPGFLVRVDDTPGLKGQVVLASSAADEASQESERIGGGVFTHHLVTGLRGAADSSGDGAVTLEEAYGYAYHQTLLDTSGSLGGVQHPTYKLELSGRGELVLTRARTEATSILFPEGSDGTWMIFDRAHKTFVGEVRLEGASRRLGLPPGRYLVQKRGDDHLLAAEVTLSRGVSARLEEADMERRPLEDDYLKGVVAANRLRAQGPRQSLRLGLGAQALFDTPVRDSLVPATPLMTLGYERRGWPAATLALRVDLGLGQVLAVQAIDDLEVPVRFSEAQLSAGVVKILPLGRVSAWAGARLTGLYLRRAFLPPLEQADQTFTSITPGLVAGLDVPLGRRAGLSVEGRLHYLYYYAGEDLSLGYGELGLGTFFRF